jgi:hypothetical protein
MKRCAAHYYEVTKDWRGPEPGLPDDIEGNACRGTLLARLPAFLDVPSCFYRYRRNRASSRTPTLPASSALAA